MTEKQFMQRLAKVGRGRFAIQVDNECSIRAKVKGHCCPVAFMARQAGMKGAASLDYEDTGRYLGLQQRVAEKIAHASDNHLTRLVPYHRFNLHKARPTRKRLLAALGLKEAPTPAYV